MIITNPTSERISIVFRGTDYALEAGESDSFSDEVTNFWKGIHQFIGVEAEKKVEVKKETPKVEEKKEEPKVEPKVEEKKEVKTK